MGADATGAAARPLAYSVSAPIPPVWPKSFPILVILLIFCDGMVSTLLSQLRASGRKKKTVVRRTANGTLRAIRLKRFLGRNLLLRCRSIAASPLKPQPC